MLCSNSVKLTILPPLIRRLRGVRLYQSSTATMAAVQATNDALDPSNSSKATMKLENVSDLRTSSETLLTLRAD